MKKIVNWTFGSVFRTFGRIIAYLIFGGLLCFLLQKSNIDITKILGIGHIKADSTYSFTTKQSRIYYDNHGSINSANWHNIPYTHSSQYPIAQMEYRLGYSDGFLADNTYTFNISYEPSPDAISISGLTFTDGTNILTQVNCSGWSRTSSGVYNNVCSISPNYDISSSGYLYVKIVFDEAYLDTLISGVGNFTIAKGTGAMIQDSTIDIMNNNNSNTQNIIDNQNNLLGTKCSNLFDVSKFTTGTLHNDNGSLVYESYSVIHNRNASTGSISFGISSAWVGIVSDYISVESSSSYYIKYNNSYFYPHCALYNNDKTFISMIDHNNTINTTSATKYVRCAFVTGTQLGSEQTISSLSFSKQNTSFCEYNSYISKLDETTSSINGLNDSINDDDSSGATSEANSFFSNFTTNTHGLTGIITAPLNAINSLTSATCSPLVLPLPFVNQNLTLPCMRSIYVENFGGFMNIYDVIVMGIVSYWVMVRIFALVKDFKNPDHDEIEVLDL